MTVESQLRQLRETLEPSAGLKKSMKTRMEISLAVTMALVRTKEHFTLSSDAKEALWARVRSSIDVSVAEALLEKVRVFLQPTNAVKQTTWMRTNEQLVAPKKEYHVKWVAAFAIFLLLVTQVSSLVAPVTMARSSVSFLPVRGEVNVFVGGLWQPVRSEIADVQSGTRLKTGHGEATVLFSEFGVFRMGEDTQIVIHDTSDRADIAAGDLPTVTLLHGDLWVQGLTTLHLRELSVQTSYGTIAVHQGSVAISEQESAVTVEVLDRRATVVRGDYERDIIVGERTVLSDKPTFVVQKIPEKRFSEAYVVDNLKSDAVHQQYIGQLQLERRAKRAGVVRTSPLYPVKRLARSVRELVTVDNDALVQVKLQHANNLLDEAAVLLEEGDSEAVELTLADYRNSLLAVASGSGEGSLVHFMIQEALADATADSVATLPNDEAYLIKEAILEASADVPDAAVNAAAVKEVLLVDTIEALVESVDEGDILAVQDIWNDVHDELAAIDSDNALSVSARKEAKILLSEFAFAVTDTDGFDPAIVERVAVYLPPSSLEEPVSTYEERLAMVEAIQTRVLRNLKFAKSRSNQLKLEFKFLAGHPDQGSVLRLLYNALPAGQEKEMVRKELIRIQWEIAGEKWRSEQEI